MVSYYQIQRFTQLLVEEDVSLSSLICAYMRGSVESHQFTGDARSLRDELCTPTALNNIFGALLKNQDTRQTTMKLARNVTTRQYVREIGSLLSPAAGFHFNASHAASPQLENFTSMRMAKQMEAACPNLWQLFGLLLNGLSAQSAVVLSDQQGDYLTELASDEGPVSTIASDKRSNTSESTVAAPDDMPDEDWGGQSDVGESSDEDGGAARTTAAILPHTRRRGGDAAKRQSRRTMVRQVTMFSICMINSNARCNALQAVTGLFTHSTNTPTKVVEMMSHAGLSIAPSSIHRMVRSMSVEAEKNLKTQLVDWAKALAYDNLEISYPTDQPTLGHTGSFASITTATVIPLRPGVTRDDLRWSQELWESSEANTKRAKDIQPLDLSHHALMSLLGKNAFAPDDERSIESLFAWHVRSILLNDDINTILPALKEKLREELGSPFTRGAIQPVKTTQVPLRAMNISVSSNSGNAAAIEDMLGQVGALDEDLEELVLPIHGDLGTGEKIRSLQMSRSIDPSRKDRLQFVLFINGWFHTRMAMADSLWKLWIEPDRPHANHPTSPHSIFHLCTILRPREVGKLSSNPGFRRTHNVIEHVLFGSIADSWRLLVKSRLGIELIDWKPNWKEVVELLRQLVREYVANFQARRSRPKNNAAPDMVHEQLRLFNRDALLYVATTRASRHGDIRRMEDLLALWVYMWRQTRKHKYARHVTQFLLQLDHGWPPRLAEIVRENWLVNPTGKADGFRGADWLVERNNFMHKCLHSGTGPNHTLANLIKESPLIMDYQNVHRIIEKGFWLRERTVYHPPPLMKETLAKLQDYLRGEQMNSHLPGRILPRPPVNAIAAGISAGAATPGESWFVGNGAEAEESGAEAGGREVTAGDLAVDG